MPSQIIQWFPGHMAKTRRLIAECLPNVDVVLELLDARIPSSSKNPEIARLIGNKPSLTLLTKASLADPDISARWKDYYQKNGFSCAFIDSVTGLGINAIPECIRSALSSKIENYERKGMAGRALRAMVVGIPNVGKSSLINRLAGLKKAKVEDRPGVTRDKQWVRIPDGIELLDMPGVLWPKFDDRTVGENLAITGAIKDDVLDCETIAVKLCGRLRKMYPALLRERYRIDDVSELNEPDDYGLLGLIGRKRGCLIAGGEVNYERVSAMLLDEFRSAKIGRISLETPDATSPL